MASLQDILNYPLFSIAGTPVDVATLLTAVAVGLLSLWLSSIAEKATGGFMRRKGVKDEGSIGATSRLVYYIVLCVGLSVAVHTLGINLTALFAAGAIFAIALGFAMQNITQNFVSGVILLLERTIKPGDIIEVEGRMVRVTSLGMRSTVTRTWDSDDLIIPNSLLVATTVKNFTLRDRLHRIRTLVGVSYDADMRLVRKVLEETTRALTWRVQDTDPVILMKQFGTSSVDFDVSVWVEDPFGRALGQSHLNEAVWFALKDAGITIAYPQLDLHLDQRALEVLGSPQE
jgi:small-conductance mechanosensitive channel